MKLGLQNTKGEGSWGCRHGSCSVQPAPSSRKQSTGLPKRGVPSGDMAAMCSHQDHMSLPALPAELLLQYAVGDATNYMAYGKQHGMLALDPLTGKVSEVNT